MVIDTPRILYCRLPPCSTVRLCNRSTEDSTIKNYADNIINMALLMIFIRREFEKKQRYRSNN